MPNTKPLVMLLDANREQRVQVVKVHDGAWGDRMVTVTTPKGTTGLVHERRLTVVSV